jgi:hypothetical protein
MKTTSHTFSLLGVLLTLFSAGCSQSEPKEQVGRFQLMFKPAESKAPDLVYLVDTTTGRVWTMGIKRQVTRPNGESEIEYSDWNEAVIKGVSSSK